MAFSKWMIRGGCAVAAATLLGMASAASAATPVTWNVTGVFNDGGTLSGTFTMDEYDFLLDNFSLTTTAGSLEAGGTYTKDNSFFSNTNPDYAPTPIYIDFQPGYASALHIQFANDLGVAAPTDQIIGGYQGPSFECLNSYSCPDAGNLDNYALRYLVSGEATLVDGGVPEPATWGLMIMGLGGIGAALRRRRATSFAAV
jgi:hypothetical protein